MSHGWIKSRFFRTGSVPADALDESLENVTKVTITGAELLALNATPIELVPAPGAGKALIFTGAQLHLDYNSAAYAGVAVGEDLSIEYSGGAIVAQIETTGFLDQTNDEFRWALPATTAAATVSEVTPVANTALDVSLLVGEIITGDSPLIIEVRYRTITLDLS